MTRSNTNCRTAMVAPTANDSVRESHSYEYDNNGNIVYVNTSRLKPHMTAQSDTVQTTREERFRWDEENRLLALSQNVTKEPSPCHSYRFFEATPSKSLLKLSYIENYSIILYLGNMADILVYIFEHYKITTT